MAILACALLLCTSLASALLRYFLISGGGFDPTFFSLVNWGQTILTVGSDDKVQLKTITTSNRVGDAWVVEQGLTAGERVIVEGQLKVRPGMTVHASSYVDPVSGKRGG